VASLRNDRQWLVSVAGAPSDVAGIIAVSTSGQCAFHDHGCEIHRAFGHQAIPSACQHFPRQVLLDARGVFVTLSHYCPTAADLLFTHAGPVEIVEGPPAVPSGEPEGLDAREVLPPLLRARRGRGRGPGVVSRGQVSREGVRSRAGRYSSGSGRDGEVLMDLEGYAAWEAHMVRVLTESDGPPEAALDQLDADLVQLQHWQPGNRSLREEVAALGDSRPRADTATTSTGSTDMVMRRYLAARAFASWAAYGPHGVAAVLCQLRNALTTLRQHASQLSLREAIRRTDLEQVHRLSHET
jgi:hypothetical protein